MTLNLPADPPPGPESSSMGLATATSEPLGEASAAPGMLPAGKARSGFRRSLDVFLENKLAVTGVGIFVAMFIFCFGGPLVYHTDQIHVNFAIENLPPGPGHPLGTDANGYEGYVIDVSRTFLCGDTPSSEQKEAYRVAYDCVNGMFDLVRPGMSFAEFAAKAPRVPAAYAAQRYPTMVHQAGLEDEGPGIPYPDDDRGPRRIMPERELKENMVLCLECYAGKPGAPFGVKLEDQVLVTAEGARLICTYPYEAKLLD